MFITHTPESKKFKDETMEFYRKSSNDLLTQKRKTAEIKKKMNSANAAANSKEIPRHKKCKPPREWMTNK
jgi:hypothetical protein